MADNQLPFKISSGLKNIIGKDLITDDFIAVFELVKNSFDAYATNVVISFTPDKIIIKDDGKGMDLNDINNKWLFVAYSAKKEGVEDEELKAKEFESYRDKIQAKKYYAGAKGIGRFSCDRLGRTLILTTKKASSSPKIEQIEVNWDDFEQDSEKEFLEIKVKHRTLGTESKKIKNFQHGTILEISNLNSIWDRKKKQDMRYSLEKLINPFQEKEITHSNRISTFKIFIEDEAEIEKDKKEKNERNKVHGEVKNFVFEALNLKTTQVITDISADGEFITTTLKDRGTLIYKIKRPNNSNPKLSNIHFHLFYLNRAAKANFSRLMGIPAIQFGSIFLYKNGFRVAPYGDAGDDSFGIDRRHAQGVWRFLGLRDLIGRIEIIGDNIHFKEISSRDGGLVKNEYYQSMMRGFDKACLSKLEDYVTKVQWKNKADKFNEDITALENIEAKAKLIELISGELENDNTVLEDIDTDFINLKTREILANADDQEIENLKKIAEKFGNDEYLKSARRTELEFGKLKIEKEELVQKLKEEEIQRQELELESIQKDKQLLFHQKLLTPEIQQLLEYHHNIGISASTIDGHLINLRDDLNKNRNPTKQELFDVIESITYETSKIIAITNLATAANFNADADEIEDNLEEFIRQYISKVKLGKLKSTNGDAMGITVFDDTTSNLVYHFKPLEIAIILDNLFSNSRKAKATEITVAFNVVQGSALEMRFSDNGIGIKPFNVDKVFEFGYSTTSGSGMGLHHIKNIITKYGGTIRLNTLVSTGAEFVLNFTR